MKKNATPSISRTKRFEKEAKALKKNLEKRKKQEAELALLKKKNSNTQD